jgi:uncharacterized protein YbjT (DUF2867 family)
MDRLDFGLFDRTMINTTILVIGCTGKTGKRVSDQLQSRGVSVRHGSRSAETPFDWEDQHTWAPALAGVDKVYLTYYPARRGARRHRDVAGEAAGRDIDFVSVPIDDYTAMLSEHGVPQDFIWLLNHLFTDVLGSTAELADGVQRALGREPKDFRPSARDAAATGVWMPHTR